MKLSIMRFMYTYISSWHIVKLQNTNIKVVHMTGYYNNIKLRK